MFRPLIFRGVFTTKNDLLNNFRDFWQNVPGPSIRAWRKLVAHGFVKRYEAEPLRRMGPARRWLLLQQVTQLLAKEVCMEVVFFLSPFFLEGG